jgi:hypothetical protein
MFVRVLSMFIYHACICILVYVYLLHSALQAGLLVFTHVGILICQRNETGKTVLMLQSTISAEGLSFLGVQIPDTSRTYS